MAYSKRLSEVLGEPSGVLADVSGGKASMRIARMGEDISAATVINLKNGQYGRNGKSVEIIARAYAKELLTKFGDEIQRLVGERTPAAAEKWLLWTADPRLVSLPSADLAGAIRLLDHMDAIQAEFPDYPVTVPRFSGGVRGMTVAEADEWYELLRAHIIRERERMQESASPPKDESATTKEAEMRIGKRLENL